MTVIDEPSAESYDWIVVGGGSAGSVLANRLSTDPAARVLLIEAGPVEQPELVAVPQAWPGLFGSSVDWGTTTVPQAFTGAPAPWVRGRGLGGSSAINAMGHIRGHHTSYRTWEHAGGRSSFRSRRSLAAHFVPEAGAEARGSANLEVDELSRRWRNGDARHDSGEYVSPCARPPRSP